MLSTLIVALAMIGQFNDRLSGLGPTTRREPGASRPVVGDRVALVRDVKSEGPLPTHRIAVVEPEGLREVEVLVRDGDDLARLALVNLAREVGFTEPPPARARPIG